MIKSSSGKYTSNHPYFRNLIKIESEGNPTAVSRTGATGLVQFTSATANAVGLSPSKRTDAVLNFEAGVRLTKSNEKNLRTWGIPVTNLTLYWAHNLGSPSARDLYRHVYQGKKLTKTAREAILNNQSSNTKAFGKDPLKNYLNWTRYKWRV